MSDPNEIRSNIEQTRYELSEDVDALADKVTPSKIAHRQTEKVKGAFAGMKDKVMGVASDVEDHAKSAMHHAGDSMSDMGDDLAAAPHKAAATAKGNPLAVGLIALGVGWLVSSLIPATQPEKRAANKAKDAAAPMMSDLKAEAKDVAKETADDLREPAKEAVNAVKDTATDAAETVKEEGANAASNLKDDANDAKHSLQ